MVYTYTKPRGPIAAMYSSPGPTYALPGLIGVRDHDPRSVHSKSPAWAFGVRHGKHTNDSSPGPCYLPDSRMFKNGRDGTPQFSIYSRPRDFSSFATPGPGAYTPETAGTPNQRGAPAYSFGSRHKYRTTDQNPAPNAYIPEKMMGKSYRSDKKSAPTYSLIGRSKVGGFSEDMQRSPGPGSYSVTDPSTVKRKPPHYSLTGRNAMPGDTTLKPGPGAYSPANNIKGSVKQSPAFSFGIRHSPYAGGVLTDCDVS